MQKITLEIDLHDLCIFRCALAKQIKVVSAEVEILKKTRERDLTQPERWQLPANIQQMTQEELQEQIDPWISLFMAYEYWSEELERLNSLNKKGVQNGTMGKSVGQEVDRKTGS